MIEPVVPQLAELQKSMRVWFLKITSTVLHAGELATNSWWLAEASQAVHFSWNRAELLGRRPTTGSQRGIGFGVTRQSPERFKAQVTRGFRVKSAVFNILPYIKAHFFRQNQDKTR
jgi:hypothetical protein